MNETYDLFNGTPPHQKHSATSRAAAGQVSTETKRAAVRRFITISNAYGATDQEIQDFLEMDPSTERPRRRELELQGIIIDSGRTRPTRSGRQAVVWVETENAREP